MEFFLVQLPQLLVMLEGRSKIVHRDELGLQGRDVFK